MKSYTIPLVIAAFGAGLTLAHQGTQSSQTSQTTQSSSTSSSQSSGSATASARGSGAAAGGQTASAASRGANASQKWTVTRPTHVAIYSPNPVGASNAAVASASIWEDQAKYFQLLGEQGKLLYAGPWKTGNGALLVLHCESDQDAQNIVDEDPVVKSLMYVANVRGWNVTYVGPWVVSPDRSPGSTTGQGGGTASTKGGG